MAWTKKKDTRNTKGEKIQHSPEEYTYFNTGNRFKDYNSEFIKNSSTSTWKRQTTPNRQRRLTEKEIWVANKHIKDVQPYCWLGVIDICHFLTIPHLRLPPHVWGIPPFETALLPRAGKLSDTQPQLHPAALTWSGALRPSGLHDGDSPRQLQHLPHSEGGWRLGASTSIQGLLSTVLGCQLRHLGPCVVFILSSLPALGLICTFLSAQLWAWFPSPPGDFSCF